MVRDHWNRSALQWQHVGHPLRPAPAEIQALKRLFSPGSAPAAPALLLGVTPEIARAVNTTGIHLIAVDRCVDMIQLVWPRTDVRDGVALCGDWKRIPLANGSVQYVVGDGCFTLLDYPHGYRAVFQEVQRVLNPGGRFAMRYFLRPSESESLAQIEEDLRNRRIGTMDVLKLRVAMALHETIQEGVAVDQIWRTFNQMVPEREELELLMGWDRKEIDTFDVFRGSPATFTFPTLEEVREISSSLFRETSIQVPDYELGSRCPTLVYSPRHSGAS